MPGTTESTLCSAPLMTISLGVVDAPTFPSQSENAWPLGKVVSIEAVMGVVNPCAPDEKFTTCGYGAFSGRIQPLCQCEPKIRPPLSEKPRTLAYSVALRPTL